MNLLLLLAHSVEEHDQLKLLAGLGYDVFSIGGYVDPAHPHDPKRPGLPDVPYHPELKQVIDDLGTSDNLRAAKDHIPDALIDWADAIIVHHYEEVWIGGNWDRIKHKRVIWRTVGQSVENNESQMAPYRAQGLQVVRYSPKEANIPGYIGGDALIRFYKDPDEWCGWTGEDARVINIAQHDSSPHGRDMWLNWRFWQAATLGLPAAFAGPHSELMGGVGALTYDQMKGWLRSARAYLYTGTQPASYTLGLIEAMMTGTPVVSIGPSWMSIFPYGPDLFEGHEIVRVAYDDPAKATKVLRYLLEDPSAAQWASTSNRDRAIELFGKDTIGRQWAAYLG